MFDRYPIFMLFTLWIFVHIITELGWRFGRRRSALREGEVSVEPATALLAVLGLLLAFTVAMAVDRFDTRKQLVIEEANAIGTAELRARMLPETARARSRALFEAYLERRIRWSELASDDETQTRIAREAQAYSNQLWAIVVEVGASAPTPVLAAYENALNQVIDIAAERVHVRGNRIPETVLVVLAGMMLLSSGLFAFVLGRNRKERSLDLHILAFATWLVIALIVDLDRPRRGWVKVSQAPLVELQESWRSTSPAAGEPAKSP